MAEKHTTRRRYITGKLVQRPGDLMGAFLDSSTTLLCAVDMRGEFVVFNKACERITGYTYDEMQGKSFFTLFAPSEHKKLQEIWATRFARPDGAGEIDLPWVGKDGATHLIRWYFTRFSDALGNIEFYAAIGEDITEKQRAEKALRESEQRYRSMFEGNRAIKFLIDPGDASIVEANPAACEFYGYSREKLQSMKVTDINTLSPEEILDEMARAKAQKRVYFQFRHRLANGELRDVEVNSGPIEVNGRTLLYSIVHDVTERRRAEQALHEAEERFTQLADAMSQVYYMVGADHEHVYYINSAYERVWGRSRTSLIENPGSWVDAVHPEDRAQAKTLAEKIRKLSRFEQEYRIVRADGQIVWIHDRAHEVVDAKGKRRLVGIAEDITERKQYQQKLEASEARFRTLVEEATEAICIADGAGKGIEANSRACGLFGYTREEFAKMSVADTVPAEDRALIGVRFGEMKKGIPQRWERDLLRKDGKRFPVEISARFLPDGRLMAIMRDMTERKRAEEALRESESRFRQLADAAPVFIWLANAQGQRTYFSRGWTEFTGRALDDEFGEGWLVGVHAEDAQRVSDMLADALQARQDFSIEYRLRASDGEFRWVLDHGVPRFSERGEFAGYIGSALDITERRNAENTLRDRERQYRELMEQSGDGIFIFDDKARITDVNSRLCEILSYSRSEMLTIDPARLVDGSAQSRIPLRYTQMDAGETLRIETELICKDGRRVPLDISARRVGKGRYQAVMRDMTERRRAEQALRESEQRYRAFIAQSSEGVWRFEFEKPINLDDDIEAQVDAALHGGILAECNDVMARMYGYERAEQIIGVRISGLLDMADPTNREQFRVFARAKYRVTDLESHEIGRDGVHHYFLNNVVPIFEQGKVVRIWGSQRDVTERREAAQALRESEERYRRLSGATAEAILIHEQGRILDANQRAADMFGYAAGDLPNLLAFNLATPRTRQTVIDNVRNGVETPYEAEGLRKDGTTFPGEITARNLALGGKQVRVVAIRDIAERKRAEEALRHEAGIIRLMQRVAMAANESSSSSAAIRLCIDEICAYTGWPVGDAFMVEPASRFLVPTDIWHLDDETAFAEFKRVTMGSRFSPGVGLPGRVLADSKPHWITNVMADDNFPRARAMPNHVIGAGFAFPVLVGREVAAVLEFFTPQVAPPDPHLLEIMGNIGTQLGRVVERERANELLEARVAERTSQLEFANRELSRRAIDLEAINRELEAFSYSVSHDLRAPLRGIFGFSQALQEDYAKNLDASGSAMLERIKAASQRMGRLIDDLLGLSRVTRAEMVRETVDLSAMAGEICTELRRTYPNRQVDVEIQPGIKAIGDARMLRILLQNLLDNAFKFTARKDRARIEFSTEQSERGLAYTVSDDGAGFEMQYAPKLFGAFQRLHSMKEFEGTGIGLATVQRIVHRHGGRVRAKGAPGEGASIQFTLGPKES